MKYLFYVGALLLGQSFAKAQVSDFPLGAVSYDYLERLELKTGHLNNGMFTGLRPFSREDAYTFLKGSGYWKPNGDFPFSKYLAREMPFLVGVDSSKRPVLNTFYRTPAFLYMVDEDDFKVTINPVLGFSLGKESQGDGVLYRNIRGLELRGTVDHRVGFNAFITENQMALPTYVDEWVDSTIAVPGTGFWKNFKDNGYDYFVARGYVLVKATRHISARFGHGRNFIGNGHRSLLLSDFTDDYLFLRINTKVWRMNYQNLFAEFTDLQASATARPYRKKYGAFHFLSLDIAKKWNVGIFEGVIFSDDMNDGRRFELGYLNPIIFYRAVEHDLGSPDNVLVGANLRFLPFRGVSLFGQVVFDEFLLGGLLGRDSSGWWGNKYGDCNPLWTEVPA